MTDSNNSTPSNYKGMSAPQRAFLASAAVLGIIVIAGGGFAIHYDRVTFPATIGSAHAAPVYPAQSTAGPAGFADLAAEVKPAVISVRVRIDEPVNAENQKAQEGFPFFQFGPPDSEHQVVTGVGSGFFISADGYAVTNYHVVDHADSVQVTTDGGKAYSAKVVGTDQKTDLALIKVDGGNFPYVTFADQEPRVGDWVLAVGNPFGLGGTVTAGIVSAEGRDIGSGPYEDYIQIDAPINRGNSGGPAFNLNGNVIGINTAIFSPSGGSVGIGFDIPATTAKAIISQLREHGHVTRGWIGVQIQRVTPDIAEGIGIKTAEGALVDQPEPNSPAAKADLKSGDVITAVNGEAVKDSRALARTIAAGTPGTSVTLTVLRNGEVKNVPLTLGTMPNAQQARATPQGEKAGDNGGEYLGFALAPARSVPEFGDKGVVVVGIDLNGTAAEHGIQLGDVILDVDRKAVSSPRDLQKDLSELHKEGKKDALTRIKSNQTIKFVALPLPNSHA